MTIESEGRNFDSFLQIPQRWWRKKFVPVIANLKFAIGLVLIIAVVSISGHRPLTSVVRMTRLRPQTPMRLIREAKSSTSKQLQRMFGLDQFYSGKMRL